jgi:Icc-related predicted phosphoesterase
MRMNALVLLLALPLAPAARAEEEGESEGPPKTFDAYAYEYESTCVGAIDGKQAADEVYDLGEFHYVLNGARVKITRTKPRTVPGEIRLGVLSSIKDDEKETRANLDDYLARFKAAAVDAILVGGDTALNEPEFEPILTRLAALGVPVLSVIGNAENRSAFNRGHLETFRKHRNVMNMDLVRVADLDGFDVVSLPGYFDPRYTHQPGYCMYKPADARSLKQLVESVEGPVVLLTHGPPKQSGKAAIDFVPAAGNVGDPDLTEVISASKIPFGAFGHILEAGGKATDLTGKKEIKPGTYSETLYLNPGSANSLPWRMNSGPDSYGMAAILTLTAGSTPAKAKYEIFRSPQRIGRTEEPRIGEP